MTAENDDLTKHLLTIALVLLPVLGISLLHEKVKIPHLYPPGNIVWIVPEQCLKPMGWVELVFIRMLSTDHEGSRVCMLTSALLVP